MNVNSVDPLPPYIAIEQPVNYEDSQRQDLLKRLTDTQRYPILLYARINTNIPTSNSPYIRFSNSNIYHVGTSNLYIENKSNIKDKRVLAEFADHNNGQLTFDCIPQLTVVTKMWKGTPENGGAYTINFKEGTYEELSLITDHSNIKILGKDTTVYKLNLIGSNNNIFFTHDNERNFSIKNIIGQNNTLNNNSLE